MAPAVAASPVRAGSEGAASRQEPGCRGADAAPGPGDRHYLSGGFRGLGWQYSSSLASACSHTARLPHGEVSGRPTDGVIELRLLPPGFTELGFTGFDLMPSRDQIRAVAQDVGPALRAPAQRPQPHRWPDGAPATLRPGPGRTPQPPSHQPARHRKPPALPPGRNGPRTVHGPAKVPVKAPPLPAAGLTRGTANHTDGVKTSHPASRKAAHGPNGYHDQPTGDRGCPEGPPVTSRRRRP